MKVTINRTTEYNVSDVPFESFDLRVESTGSIETPLEVTEMYQKLRKILNKALKEDK